ncbi:YbhB/YbcL family Raf kinase inhibitor-like protein [Variovorax paradoxus]|uniref:YbhB/YbcL family Raf kinase inhibitor-like protein n=1 Tax=Variovorax paradoxus TaxID=34073 RepID=UPI0029C7040D|nr:YbhB/YbcL family Raf kinase inhibitor-like protein [Variovorax paradoxus]
MSPWLLRWIGLPLRGRRAGEGALVCNDPVLAALPQTLALRSDSFGHNQALNLRQAGEGVGRNLSPELNWAPLPDGATHWALLIEDPDVPLRQPWLHGVATGPADVRQLAEGAMSGYAGARPLPGHGTHRYVFQLFALNEAPGPASTREALMPSLRRHAIARGRLDGLFRRDWLHARPVAP